MWQRAVRIAQPILFFLIGIALIFWQSLSPLIPWNLETLLGATITLAAGLIFYFDRRFDSLAPRDQSLIHTTISNGIAQAVRHIGEPRVVRIYAFSTFMIQPILRDLKPKLGECVLLLYNPNLRPDRGAPPSAVPMAEMDFAPIGEWLHMKHAGVIEQLDIKAYGFFPLTYFIVFEDRALLVGHYLIQDHRLPKSEVQEPYLVLDETPEGKILIRKHLEVFESLRHSTISHPVSEPTS